MPKIVEKAVAYITQRDKLLVFRHTLYPEAGIQVPAGTIKNGESSEEASLREAREETGLEELTIRSFVGVQDYDLSKYGLDEVHRRYFYHLEFTGNAPIQWLHSEKDPSDGQEPIEFELFWVKMPDKVPDLIRGLGDLLKEITNQK